MFDEALSAVHTGDRARARDLFTRLLKVSQDNPDYWVWMSAVVETTKERAFCLKEALRIDPDHPAAQRGLLIIGAVQPDPALAVPGQVQKRGWQSGIELPEGELQPPIKRVSGLQIGIIGAAFVLVVGLIAFALFGMKDTFRRSYTRPIIIMPTNTAGSVAQVTQTASPIVITTPRSLADRLKVTYTPTPLYVNTPHSVSEAFSIGLRAYQRGDWQKAQEFFQQVVGLEPGAADIHYYLGESYRQQGSFSRAIQAYNEAIVQNASFAPAYLGRAQANLALNPKKLDDVEKDLQTALANDPDLAVTYLVLAEMQVNNEKPQQALEMLNQALKLIPDSPMVYLYRAEAYLALDNPEKALEDARRANEMDVTLLQAYRMIGEALQAGGDFEGSMEPLNTYILYEPDDAQVWSWIANAQLAAGDRKAARHSLNQALKRDSRQFDGLMLRGALLLEENEAEQALDDYELAVKIDPASFDAAMGVARALMGLDYPGDAYQQIERSKILAEKETQKAEWQFMRAQSLEALGEIVIALRDYQSVVTLPAGVADEVWVKYAKERIAALEVKTPTPRPKTATPTPTPTHTRQPTRTMTPTQTRQPTATRTP